MPKLIRTKIKPKRNLPIVWQTTLLAISLFVLEIVIVMTTSPKNKLAFALFFLNLLAAIIALLHSFKLSYLLSVIFGLVIVFLALLKVFQILSIINVVLVIAIGICFASFAKQR